MRPSAAWCRRSRRGRIWCICRAWCRMCCARAGRVTRGDLGGDRREHGARPDRRARWWAAASRRGWRWRCGVPFVAVNHLEAHALTARLPGLVPKAGRAFPYLLLLLSGGHCQCVAVDGAGPLPEAWAARSTTRWGRRSTRWASCWACHGPAGPHLERLAAGGDAAREPFPRPLRGPPRLRLQLLRVEDRRGHSGSRPFPPGALPVQAAADVAAGFQAAVADVLADRAGARAAR